MLRDYSDSLSSHLLQAFPPDHSYSRVEFSREPMPTLVSHFLAQTLQSRLDIEIERHRSVRSDWFAYDHPDVQHAHLTFAAMLGQHAHIPRNEWSRLLKDSVHTVLSFLVRPVPTLVDFLFDEEEVIPVHDVYRGLGFFGAYPYLREVATTYLHQKNLMEVDRARFMTILRHSDHEMSRDDDASEWLDLLSPLLGMLDMDPANVGRGVPVEVLATFFEEKEAGNILLHLREAEAGPNARITEQELRRIIEEPPHPIVPRPLRPQVAVPEPETALPEAALPEAPEPDAERPATVRAEPHTEPVAARTEPALPVAETAVESHQPEHPAYRVKPEVIGIELPAPPPAPRAVSPAPPSPPISAAPEEAPPAMPVERRPEPRPTPSPTPAPPPPKGVPLWQQFQKSNKPPEARAETPPVPQRPAPRVQLTPRPPSPRPPEQNREADARSVPLWMQFRKSKPEQSHPPDLDRMEQAVLGEIERRERELFVKQLFGGSVAEYGRALQQLQAAPSWDRAKQIIATEVFVRHRVDIYSDAAMAFTNAVEERYGA